MSCAASVIDARRQHLQLVDGGDHHRALRDQPGLGCDRELEIAEAAALAEPRARIVDGDAAGDHEVDRLELVDVDGPRAASTRP